MYIARVHYTLRPLQWTVYIRKQTFYTVHCIPCTYTLCIMYTVHRFTHLYNVHCTMYTVHYTHVQCTPYVQCTPVHLYSHDRQLVDGVEPLIPFATYLLDLTFSLSPFTCTFTFYYLATIEHFNNLKNHPSIHPSMLVCLCVKQI